MNPAWSRRLLTGRGPVVACALLVAAIVMAVYALSGGNRILAWKWVLVPTDGPSFADTRTITHAIDAQRRGLDPYVDTENDPWGRSFNYPRFILQLSRLGIGERHTDWVGGIMVGLAIGALGWLLAPVTPAGGLLVMMMVLSPSVLLGVERGNIDLLIFSLFTFSFLAVDRVPGWLATGLRAGAVVVLAMLKIYPAAIALAVITDRRTILKCGLLVGVAAGCFLGSLQPGDLAAIRAYTPQAAAHSFGAASLAYGLTGHVVPGGEVGAIRTVASLVAVGVMLAAAGWVGWRRPALGALFPRLRAGDGRDDVVIGCLAVYVFVFLLGSNFDYRLVFLVGATTPWLRAPRPGVERSRWVIPVMIAAFLWLSRISARIFFVDEILGWLLFVGAVVWLTATLLERITTDGPAASRELA